MEQQKTRFGIDALTLKILAMVFMIFDHVWATVWSVPWFTMIGRLAFPIFAFQIAEGFHKTSNRKRYMKRMLLFALISEIPFNLMTSASLINPFHQNVMFTFLIAMVLMSWMERNREKPVRFVLVSLVCALLSFVGTITFVDYFHYGVLMVLVFYWTYGMRFGWVLQLIGLVLINDAMAGLVLTVELFGHSLEISKQMLSLFALIPIWLYNGKQGYHSKAVQLGCYAFYPVHMLLLYLLAVLLH